MKVGKKKVQDKFNSNNYPIDLIIKNIELQKKSEQWQRAYGENERGT
jgi:hypothetical protein